MTKLAIVMCWMIFCLYGVVGCYGITTSLPMKQESDGVGIADIREGISLEQLADGIRLGMFYSACLQEFGKEFESVNWEQTKQCENDFPSWLTRDFDIVMPSEEEFYELAGEDGRMDLEEFFSWGYWTLIDKHNLLKKYY